MSQGQPQTNLTSGIGSRINSLPILPNAVFHLCAESGGGRKVIGTALPLAVAAVYALMFVLVVRLFRCATKKRRPMVMDQLNRE